MQQTYTYTARSAENPSHVATFTLHGGQMSVDMSVGIEAAERVAREAREKAGAIETAKAVAGELPRLQPAVARLMQSSYDINDVSVNADGKGLMVMAWTRLAGLKAAPVVLTWSRVDNPDAASAFAAEVNKRQRQTEDTGTLPGPLDYWGTWVAGVVLGGLVVWRLLKDRNGQS